MTSFKYLEKGYCLNCGGEIGFLSIRHGRIKCPHCGKVEYDFAKEGEVPVQMHKMYDTEERSNIPDISKPVSWGHTIECEKFGGLIYPPTPYHYLDKKTKKWKLEKETKK